jgi:hypothetical protein
LKTHHCAVLCKRCIARHYCVYLEDASSTMVEIEGITAISSIKGPLKQILLRQLHRGQSRLPKTSVLIVVALTLKIKKCTQYEPKIFFKYK